MTRSARPTARAARWLAALALALFAGASHAEPPTSQLEVHFIDVGQGDAILIRSPAGRTVLIDAGNTEAADAVNAYLAKLGVAGLDLAVVSHPHLDHMGGMLEVLKKHRPASYIDPSYAHPLENYDELLDWLEAEQIPVRTARGGRTITLEPGITLDLFAPTEPLLSGTRSDCNSNSIVMKLVYGTKSFLFTGDSEDDTEKRVISGGYDLRSTVLKVAHHGGRHSTSDGWLGQVEPEFAVISCGQLNGYKHPTPETLGRLSSRGIHTYRTDRDGDVVARTDGRTLTWETTGELSAKLDERGGRRSFRIPGRDEHERPAPAAIAGPVDLNTASAAELERLPGIGTATAKAIVADRAKLGPFTDVDALMRVRGIGRGTVDQIRSRAITSKGAEAPQAAVVAEAKSAPEPAPVPVVANAGGAAPRPTARPGAAFRVTPRTAALARNAATEVPAGTGGRLLSGPRRVRVNLNLANAEAIARGTDISLDQARLVVQDRLASGPFHSVTELSRVKGLGADERAALLRGASVRIELNRASEADLVALGLERLEANAIVERRREIGMFASIDELEEVEDLAPKKRAKILPLLTVDAGHWN